MASSSSSSDRVLLPADVVPSRYNLTLAPNFTTFKAKGHVEIDVTVVNSVSQIQVHAKELTIHSVEFVSETLTTFSKDITFNEKEERAIFDFGTHQLPAGKALLKIDFDAVLNDSMAGFYRSKYIVNGETRWMATTQFEATDARRAFPCWDEPAIKAVFEVTLVVPEDRVALSNMLPVSEQRSGDDKTKTVKFAPSPIMSTYLLAFIVGEFDYVEDHTKDAIPVRVRVYTPPGKSDSGKFALGVATKTLTYFAEYFGIGYPLPKLDMVAIADFAAGAMENWGLVTYREIALLADEKASVSMKQRVAYVVAHELAHQWFGNLVTMEWWSQLWLNEGFATFVGNLATNHLFPQWDIWTLFVNDYQFSAFELDALKNSHPIEVDVKSSAQIGEIFDAISYHKGSCVIRMLERYLGEENFKLGLNRYLNRFNYRNAVTEDLWQALAEQSKVDVKSFMDAFTKKVGYPIVTVKRGAQEGTFEVSQERFLGGEKTDDETLWHISLEIVHNDKIVKEFLHHKSATLHTPFKNDQWIKFNFGQSGFYRVKYSPELLAQLLVPLKELQLKPVDRLGVQSDVFALAKSGVLPTSQFLDVAAALASESDYTVWNSLAGNVGAIQNLFSKEPVAPQLAKFVQQLFVPLYSKLGWKPVAGERDVDALLRSIVLRKLAGAKYQPVIDEAKKLFEESLKDPASLPADLRVPVYETVAANGNEHVFQQLVEVYQKTDNPELKVILLQILSEQPTEELTREAFTFSLSPDVRDQDLYILFLNVHSTRHGSEVAWRFLRDHWEEYHRRLSKGSMILTRIIGKCTERFASEDKAVEVETFFQQHPYEAADRTVKQSVENIRRNARWLNAARDDVTFWLSAHSL